MNAIRKTAALRMTLDEFLAWDPATPDVRRWQLIDGEPKPMSPSIQAHAAIQAELARLIGNHLIAQASRCRVLTEAGVVPNVRAGMNYRIPDLAVTCSPQRGGPVTPDPVLLIEIISPNSERYTRAQRLTFATIPTVSEIVLLHATRMAAEVLRRAPDGSWPEHATLLGQADALTLASIDLAVPLIDAYRTTDLASGSDRV